MTSGTFRDGFSSILNAIMFTLFGICLRLCLFDCGDRLPKLRLLAKGCAPLTGILAILHMLADKTTFFYGGKIVTSSSSLLWTADSC